MTADTDRIDRMADLGHTPRSIAATIGTRHPDDRDLDLERRIAHYLDDDDG